MREPQVARLYTVLPFAVDEALRSHEPAAPARPLAERHQPKRQPEPHARRSYASLPVVTVLIRASCPNAHRGASERPGLEDHLRLRAFVVVEYALRGVNRPIGVASRETELVRQLPEDFWGSLPAVEEIEAELAGSMDGALSPGPTVHRWAFRAAYDASRRSPRRPVRPYHATAPTSRSAPRVRHATGERDATT